MVNTFEGKLYASENDRFCIVISRFNDFIGAKLLEGAIDTFKRLNVKEENIDFNQTETGYQLCFY